MRRAILAAAVALAWQTVGAVTIENADNIASVRDTVSDAAVGVPERDTGAGQAVVAEPVQTQPAVTPAGEAGRTVVRFDRPADPPVEKRRGVGRFEFTLDIGYGTGLARTEHKRVVEAEYDTSAGVLEYSKYDDRYYSYGNGMKGSVGFCAFFSDHAGIAVMANVSTLGGYSNTSTYNDYDLHEKLSSNALAFGLGLKLRGGSGRLSPYLCVMPAICLPFGVTWTSEDDQPGWRSVYTEKLSFTPGFGFLSQVGAQLEVGRYVALDFCLRPSYACARLKEVKWKYEDLEDGSTSRGTEHFVNDETDLEDTANTDYSHGQPVYSFSSLDFVVGVVLRF